MAEAIPCAYNRDGIDQRLLDLVLLDPGSSRIRNISGQCAVCEACAGAKG